VLDEHQVRRLERDGQPLPELVRAGVDGWLVSAGDVEALAEAMRRAISAL